MMAGRDEMTFQKDDPAKAIRHQPAANGRERRSATITRITNIATGPYDRKEIQGGGECAEPPPGWACA